MGITALGAAPAHTRPLTDSSDLPSSLEKAPPLREVKGEMPTQKSHSFSPQDSKGSLKLWGCSVSLCKAALAKRNPGIIYSKIHINTGILPSWEKPLVV